MNTELISANSYDVSRMIFSDPVEGAIPDSTIKYKRINISTLNDDGSVGELVLPTEKVYSYGVSENINMNSGKVDGYVLPLVLFNKNGASDEEKNFVDTFNNIVEKCKEYLLENKDELGQYELEKNDLKKLNPIFYKRDKGKIVEGSPPTLYAKLIVKKDKKDGNKIISVFFDEDTGDNVNPLELLGKACYARAVIKFESIFIGNKISLQVKLYEAEVKTVNTGMRRLLPRPTVEPSRVSEKMTDKPRPLDDDDDGDDVGSLTGGDDDVSIPVEETVKEIEVKKAPLKKPAIKKVKAKE